MYYTRIQFLFVCCLTLTLQAGPAPAWAQSSKKEPGRLVAPFDKAKADVGQAAWASHLKINRTETNTSGIEMVLIPPGEYLRGSDAAEVGLVLKSVKGLPPEALANEQPQHRVVITKPIFMSKFETTQEQFEKVMGRNAAHFSASGLGKSQVRGLMTEQHPVENVTWFDAVEFCNKLSELEGKTPCYELIDIARDPDQSINSATVQSIKGNGYRLPTEAEWEHACRAGTNTPYYFGAQLNGEQANVNGQKPLGTTEKGPKLALTSKVGSFSANNFGLHDMCGNVSEWCQDGFSESAYSTFKDKPATDPVFNGAAPYKLLRGGAWRLECGLARSAARSAGPPGSRSFTDGFRVVRSCNPKN